MVLVLYADNEPNTFMSFEPIYSKNQHTTDHDNNNLRKKTNLLFDFEVVYRRAPGPDSDSDSDGEEDINVLCNLETRIVRQTHEFDRDCLIGGDRDQIQATVYQILDMIQVPSYSDIVHMLTLDILDLKKREDVSDSPGVERVRVWIDVIVRMFPGDADDVDVKLAVAPASDEAVEKHLETVVGGRDEGFCVLCVDTILAGSDVAAAAGRMPCSHVFHRKCVEEWLRNSGICPVCRAVFPS